MKITISSIMFNEVPKIDLHWARLSRPSTAVDR